MPAPGELARAVGVTGTLRIRHGACSPSGEMGLRAASSDRPVVGPAHSRGRSGFAPAQSGERPRFISFRPDETLGAACMVALSSLGLAAPEDDADIACRACSTEPLRAAAWLRSRGAAVRHAVAPGRSTAFDGAAYMNAARTRLGPKLPCNVDFGEVSSAALARWARPDRIAIIFVGNLWPTAVDGIPHALAVLGGRTDTEHGEQLLVFDPAGHGLVEEVAADYLDIVRDGPDAWMEVLCIGRRLEVSRDSSSDVRRRPSEQTGRRRLWRALGVGSDL